ncbi:MAG: gluconokinase [Chloroflexota bacterium]|nr:gluconokinase [Chloroflexota bacterium]
MAQVALDDAQTPFVLTFDVGTSSVRALIYDAQARPIDGMTTQIAHEMTTTADGGVFCDADALVERTATVIDGVLAAAGAHAAKIGGVASDTFWHNVVGMDADGAAITPLYTWADTRSEQAATALRHHLDERAVHQRTGCMLHAMYLPAKFVWLAETDAALFRRVTYWMSFAEYFHYTCFSARACSLSMASGSGLLNLNTCQWDEEMLAALPVQAEQLSPLRDVDEPLSGLTGAFAERWPSLAHIPWYLSLGDGAASNLGSGGVNGSRIAVNAGTSTAMRLVLRAETVHVPDGLWAYRVDRRHVVVGGAESNGGNAWAWLKERMRLDDDDATARAIAAVPPDGHGLTVLPFLAGERSPNYNARARAAIIGLGLDTTAPEIARAFLEAISYRLALMHRIIAADYPEAREIIISGSALLNNPTWMQMLADVLGMPLTVSDEAEATSRGAALIALEQLGAIPSWEDVPIALGKTVAPHREAHQIYQAAIERQERIYHLLVPPRT